MKFSDSVQGLIAETRKIAEKLDNDFIGLQHFLLAYNKFDDSALTELKISLSVKKDLIGNVKGLELAKYKSSDFPLTKDFEFVLKCSGFQRWILGDKVIEPKHLYLSILLIDTENRDKYIGILNRNSIQLNSFKKRMIHIQFNPFWRIVGIAKILRKIALHSN